MKSRFLWPTLLLLPLVLIATSCRTDLAVNFGNGTSDRVMLRSSQTGNEIEIQPSQFRKLPHSDGDLIVTTERGRTLTFRDVSPVQVDRKFWGGRDNVVGPDSIVLTLRLQSDHKLYVLRPDQRSVEPDVEQPKGYPKTGDGIME